SGSGDGNDTTTGGAGDATVPGGDGDDTTTGGDGDDTVTGGDGDDTTTGGGGDDTVTGGDGDDTTTGGGGDDTVTGGDGDDTTTGGGGDDTVTGGDGDDTTTGGGGDDTVTGGDGDDTTTGGGGDDTVTGGDGDDTTTGGGGDDTVTGGDGDDTTPGGGGDDTTTGGGGDPIVPTVDDPDAHSTLTTNTTDPAAVVTGTGEAGSTVVVILGDQTIETTVGSDGTWGVTFEDGTFPSDGDLTSTVFVTAPDGTLYELDGPDFLIDMTPPEVDVTSGAMSTGDVENLAEYQDGITVTGSGEVGAAITVTVAGVTQATTVAADGTWSVTFGTDQLPEGEYQEAMTITATDINGNVTTITDTLVVDTVPNAIEFDSVTPDNVVNSIEIAGDVTVSGTSVAGAVLAVTMEGVTHEVTVAADGTWSVVYSAGELPEGTYDTTITATTVDPAENASSASWTVHVDTETSVAFTTGLVTTDGVVNAAEDAAGFTLTGTSEPGSSVLVTLGGVTVAATVAADGSWSADFSGTGLTTGSYDATVTATDAYGNTATDTMTVTFDTETTAAFDAGQTGGDDVISGAERGAGVVLTGTAEAGATVAVTLEGVTHTVTAAADGSWQASFATDEIPAGSYITTATITATDLAGNTASASHEITVDTEVQNLTHGTETPNAILADGIVNAAEAAGGLVVTGTVEIGSTVTVQLASGAVVAATVAEDGTWSATIPASQLPTVETDDVALTVTATDAYGNTASQTSTIDFDPVVTNFVPSATVSGDDIVNAQEAADGFAITGTVEAGSTVVVTLANGATETVTAGANGQWAVSFTDADLPEGSGSMSYEIAATDTAGNTASATGSFDYDLVAPESPDIIAFTRDAGSLLGIRTDVGEATYDISAIDGSGHVTDIENDAAVNSRAGYGSYDFYETVPNGSYLVVTDSDTAGNETSTLLVVDNTSAVTVDLDRSGLSEFDFGTIDLTFAPEAQLTITESQLEAITGPENTLIIQGDSADHVTAIGAEDTGGDTVIGGHTYSIYTLGDDGASLIIDDNITNLTI
ncbi:MAG: beta strand repeat-containing protein, partial [Paenirhodobacter sp.]|uniref:beta strand repeat-containing protein n=1 Tax=Paenirhodobacter sp. TaxID=1965326 RepID=UPI003D0D0530